MCAYGVTTGVNTMNCDIPIDNAQHIHQPRSMSPALQSLEQFYCHPFENGIESSKGPIVVAIKLSGGGESRGFSVSNRISSLLAFIIAAFSGPRCKILGRLARHHIEVSAQKYQKKAHIDISMFFVLIYSPGHSFQCRLGLFAVCGRM